jgi:hypothetical protein
MHSSSYISGPSFLKAPMLCEIYIKYIMVLPFNLSFVIGVSVMNLVMGKEKILFFLSYNQ